MINQVKQLAAAKKGQGIVEYAGALVVATVVVTAAMTWAPTAIAAMFAAVVGKINTAFGI